MYFINGIGYIINYYALYVHSYKSIYIIVIMYVFKNNNETVVRFLVLIRSLGDDNYFEAQ